MLKAILRYFDRERQLRDSFYRIRELTYQVRGAEVWRSAMEAANKELREALAKRESEISAMSASRFITEDQVMKINAKIEDLNDTIRSIADAEKIIAALEVLRRKSGNHF